MGQNQDKLDGGEQVLGAAPEETSPDPDSGSAGDVMEGSSCEAEAGNSGENRGEPDAQDPDGCSSQLWVRPFAGSEVRQGGAAGMAGRGGGEGGEGGWANETDLRETEENPKCSPGLEETARAYKLHSQTKRERKSAEGEPHRSRAKMEGTGRCSSPEEIQGERLLAAAQERCEHAFASEEPSSGEGTPQTAGTSEAQTGRELLSSVRGDESDAITAGTAAGDIKLSAGTVGRLSKRKGPPTAQSLHPLKNSEKKEPLSDMSDTIHRRPANGRTENNTKEGTLACDAKSHRSPSRPSSLDARQAEATASNEIGSNSSTGPASNAEPSSILEKLLMRNKKQKTLPDVGEADASESDSVDDAAQRIVDSAAAVVEPPRAATHKPAINTHPSTRDKKRMDEELRKGNAADKDRRRKGQDVKEHDASHSPPVLRFQSGKSRTNPESARAQSAGVNESASPPSDLTLPSKGDEQSADSCALVPAEKPNCVPGGSESNADQTSLESAETTLVSRVSQHAGNAGSDAPGENAGKNNQDGGAGRDESQDLPKSRPVSELIKETVQLHEKLLHQEWSKPAEVKADEQGQSVKVAKMKAAFDAVQKSPDRAIERKPSVRKGKGKTPSPEEQFQYAVNSEASHLLLIVYIYI